MFMLHCYQNIRGASPIIAPILNGDISTGVAIMEMEKGLDTGAVFASFEHRLTGQWKTRKVLNWY